MSAHRRTRSTSATADTPSARFAAAKGALPLAEWTEKQLDATLFAKKNGAAPTLGWRSYHTLRSKGSEPGFPDRVCVRERLIFVETKGPKTPVTDEQVAWLTALAKAGQEVYLVRPADFEAFVTVLGSYRVPPVVGCRWSREGYRFDEREAAAA